MQVALNGVTISIAVRN